MRLRSMRIIAAAAAFFIGACDGAGTGDTARMQFGLGEDAGAIPFANVHIGDNLEIDDLDQLGTGNKDADLFAGATADDPDFPGPDPSCPSALGTGYKDWNDLTTLANADDIFQQDLSGGTDDIMKTGSCVGLGPSPGKANIQDFAVAGNANYLYFEFERESSNGQEEYHIDLTQKAPYLGTGGGCSAPTYLWDLQDGDVQITVFFPSTAHLADGTILIEVFDADLTAGPDTGLTAEQVLNSPGWTTLTAGSPTCGDPVEASRPAYVVFNVARSNKLTSEDNETKLDGTTVFDTAELAEAAVDVAAVFGAGCGLSRAMTIITTASGSAGGNDDYKDFFGPLIIQTGNLGASLALTTSCPTSTATGEKFQYDVTVMNASGGTSTGVTLPDTGLDVAVKYDCGGGEITVEDDDGTGTVNFPVTTTAAGCSVYAEVTGKAGGQFEGCSVTTASDSVTIYPDLALSADVDGTCSATAPWTFSATASGGSGSYDYDWTFTPTPTGAISPTSATVASSSSLATAPALLNSDRAPVAIAGSLTVTDTGRDDDLGCTIAAGDSDTAYHPLTATLTLGSSDLSCPVAAGDATDLLQGNVDVSATGVTGGSGAYDYVWGGSGDVDPVTCGDLATCTFGLDDTKPCASGTVTLIVEDENETTSGCADVAQQSLTANKTTTLDVPPLAP